MSKGYDPKTRIINGIDEALAMSGLREVNKMEKLTINELMALMKTIWDRSTSQKILV